MSRIEARGGYIDPAIERVSHYVKEKDCYSYNGYKFYRDGMIVNPGNQDQPVHVDVYGIPSIGMVINKKKRRINVARVMYEMYSGEPLSMAYSVRFKDNDPHNVSYDNLYIMRRGDMLKKRKNTKLFTREEARKIYEEYHRFPKPRNQFNVKEGQMSQRQLSIKYQCSIYIIEKIVSGEYYSD